MYIIIFGNDMFITDELKDGRIEPQIHITSYLRIKNTILTIEQLIHIKEIFHIIKNEGTMQLVPTHIIEF